VTQFSIPLLVASFISLPSSALHPKELGQLLSPVDQSASYSAAPAEAVAVTATVAAAADALGVPEGCLAVGGEEVKAGEFDEDGEGDGVVATPATVAVMPRP
jgi:hypothetical protein